ncbi:cytochrome p450 2c8 [Plakobranchus ocellatus]|uniref:Cytochrome p450 2c8 n=1 Tax=Plakobranchus ocellatus TaxID=259542 RepID=A0AAV4AD93_9GAST|nr:cytochrome p450 2c8 [Plakobranchus ocellatus]
MADLKDSIGITWALASALIGLLVYKAWSWIKPRNFGHNIPPFPAPRKLLLGHLHLYTAKSELETIKALRDKAGDVFSLDLAGNLLVVVNGFENVKEVLVKRWNEAPDRPHSGLPSYIGEDNHGVVDSRGENWVQQRSTSMLILRSFGMGKNVLAEKILEEVTIYMDKLASFKGNPVDIRFFTTVSIANVICSIIVGKRFDHDDPCFAQVIEIILSMFNKAPAVALMQTIPFVRFIPGDLFGMKAFMNNFVRLNDSFSKPHIAEAKKTFDPNKDPECYITAYLQKMQEENAKGTQKNLDDKNLTSNIRGLLLVGSETTSTSIYWFVLHCINHPHVQDKIFEEISAKVGHDRVPNMSDKASLIYLEATIRESLRLAAVAPFMMRTVQQEFDLKGYTVPKDTLLFINMRSALHDSDTWADPDMFRPERYFDDTGNLLKIEAHIPFGLGKRSCLGEALAKMELFLFLAALCQKFRMEPEIPGKFPSMKGRMEILFSPQTYKVRLVARHPNM